MAKIERLSHPVYGTIWRGWEEDAKYCPQVIPDYSGNPLIEALPLIPESKAEIGALLVNRPEYDEGQRLLPAELRLHLMSNALEFFAPLSIHMDLYRAISIMMRKGYKARNPLELGHYKNLSQRLDSMAQGKAVRRRMMATPSGITLIGISGIGKSTSLQMCLSSYPQVLHHSRYNDQNFNETQITWLKLDCPQDGSPKGLCMQLFWAIDVITRMNGLYDEFKKSKLNTDLLLVEAARWCANLHVGLLIIDEIQNLCDANVGGSDRMLNFFVQLSNTIGVPIILIGTYKAEKILRGKLRQARRGIGYGNFTWHPMKEDATWATFMHALWKYQFINNPCPLESHPELSHVLYEETQGIPDFAVKAYMLAQWRSITRGDEILTSDHIRSVARDCFQPAREMLDALQSGIRDEEVNFDDVFPQNFDGMIEMAAAIPAIESPTSLNQAVEAKEVQVAKGDETIEPSARPAPFQDQRNNGKTNTIAGKRVRKKTDSITYTAGDLRLILSSAASSRISEYEALKQAGYIRQVTSYLDA
jgi:hypothetical protein